ncbi:glucose 1-dehydrogenase [Streptomyces sp. SID10853]|uniref:SDR family NAD(P)-dependent oxidoreductase n=1 Tax=Streptomyces sp. SID10853 TaxID=2706028 RepID=UPI0013C15124|nr:glucose 1-dehydrogenase [Streptomyces sp. SID10853]NDZ78748.1 glucose 1-dehydrogenase [Streptomyces sp. SID10853]
MTENARNMDGRVVMITGASSGIGAAAARLFAAHGAPVVLMARRQQQLDALVGEIEKAGGQAAAVPGDVRRGEDVERAVETALERFGRLDAAFNNAGHATLGQDLHETPDDDFDAVIDVNVRGVWNCMRHQIRAMLRTGGGSIVNTASTAGLIATGVGAPYVAAKHAVIGLTKAAASEYGTRGIRVNALAVGSTLTEMMESVIDRAPGIEKKFFARAIQQRFADPAEVAEAAMWLCGDASSFVTGATVPVDGGVLAV